MSKNVLDSRLIHFENWQNFKFLRFYRFNESLKCPYCLTHKCEKKKNIEQIFYFYEKNLILNIWSSRVFIVKKWDSTMCILNCCILFKTKKTLWVELRIYGWFFISVNEGKLQYEFYSTKSAGSTRKVIDYFSHRLA